jgi:hypothetical protein
MQGWLARMAVLALAGCGQVEGPPAGFAACAPAGDAAAPGPAAPDYWHDAKPILDAKCATCHTEGGIGPFRLLSYADLRPLAAIRAAIASRAMPPWPPGECCQEYGHPRSLSPSELDTLLRWIDAGAPEGDPRGAPPSTPPPVPRLSRVDVTLKMPEAYDLVAREETSELRCFVVEGWPFTDEKWITGVDVRPGNRSLVHHVIVQTVPQDQVAGLKARERRDGRPGFDCRELQGQSHVNGHVGGWTPGAAPQESPDGAIGVRFPARSQILLQIHYDVRNGVGAPDQTEMDFQVADRVRHQGKGLAVANPLWLAGGGLAIGAGDRDAVHTFAYDPTTIITRGHSFFVHTVALHMHHLGSRGRVAVKRADGGWECLLDIGTWNYHWSSYYELARPVEIRPGDQLYVECHWDNSAEHQAPVRGVKPPPRDLDWGTAQEMCAGLMLYTDTWP